MTVTLEEVTQKALQLPGRQRLALAGFLIEATGDIEDTGVEEAWEQEIKERIKAVDSGAVKGIPWEEVLQKAEKRLAR